MKNTTYKMAKTEPKTAFTFTGENTKTIQQDHKNITKHISFLFSTFQLYITKIQKGYLDPEVKEQHLNNLQLEEIDELQIGLKDFKVRTIALMDATAMLLHKKYQKQSKANQQSAEVVKELLNQEQNLIEKQYTDTKQQIYQILQLHNQRNITVTTLTPGASASTSTD